MQTIRQPPQPASEALSARREEPAIVEPTIRYVNRKRVLGGCQFLHRRARLLIRLSLTSRLPALHRSHLDPPRFLRGGQSEPLRLLTLSPSHKSTIRERASTSIHYIHIYTTCPISREQTDRPVTPGAFRSLPARLAPFSAHLADTIAHAAHHQRQHRQAARHSRQQQRRIQPFSL